MEIRLLYGNELQWAVYTANEVFETCVRPYAAGVGETEQYYRYVNAEHLWQEMSAGRLFLWGAFENGQMCGVSAMQDTGHITMLYVKPYCAKRRIGATLVDHMSAYANGMLHTERVTIRVSPRVASYFYHIGFTLILDCVNGGDCVPLERRIWSVPQSYPGNTGYPQNYAQNGAYALQGYSGNMGYPQNYAQNGGYAPQDHPAKPEVTYPVKKVPAKYIIVLVAGVFLFITAVITGITVYHMAGDDRTVETGNESTENGQELWEGLDGVEEL